MSSLYMGEWAEQLKAEGRAKGRAEGAMKARKESILRTLDKRGMSVSDEARELISSCRDPSQLFVWFDRAIDTWIDKSLDITYIDERFAG